MAVSMGVIVFFSVVSLSSFVYTLNTVWLLHEFLSTLGGSLHEKVYNVQQKSSRSGFFDDVVRPILWDAFLVAIFIIFHSMLARTHFKTLMAKCNLSVLQRSVYLSINSTALQLMMNYWETVTDLPLWTANVNSYATLWWIFSIVHWVAWTAIFAGCIVFDFAELMGLKQVYYYGQGLGDPTLFKSHELQRLYSHMRHPSFLAFLCIFWIYPIMTLDRYLLALMLTAYMVFQFKVDSFDYVYQSKQFHRKYEKKVFVYHSTPVYSDS